MSPPPPPSLVSVEALAFRRTLFMLCIVILTCSGLALLLLSPVNNVLFWLDYFILPIFAILLLQIATGFTLAFFGFFELLRKDRYNIMADLPPPDPSTELPGTAIIVPVYNEDIRRVARGIENMWLSLQRTGHASNFDFYILSDSNNPDCWVDEENTWLHLCRHLNAFGRIFYRKREIPVDKKSGNVADFCQRWGKRYRYMVVMDADSVMKGETLVRMVRAMEAHPQVGLIQTVPRSVLGRSLFRRILQFTSSLCGTLFSAGCNFWQLSGGSYWGHNAIIRTAPFIEHCDLPDLPDPDPKKRHILSHDTVEAALMRRAGYEVWLAWRDDGSYEEGPPTFTDMLIRDRRWCEGNLQHIWFLFARRIHFASRMHIWFGLMAYLSSPLWFTFLILSGFNSYYKQRFFMLSSITERTLPGPLYKPLLLLMVLTLAMLFIPKLLGWLAALPRAKQYGGVLRLTFCMLVEVVFSALMAPVMMLFHSAFVLQCLLGLKVNWGAQNRTDSGLSLLGCVKTYWWVTALGAVSTWACWTLLPEYFWWFSPILISWLAAIPLAWITTLPGLSAWAKKAGLFVIPEEHRVPEELQNLDEEPPHLPLPCPELPGFVRAVLHPQTHAIHVSFLRQGKTADLPPGRETEERARQLFNGGPEALPKKDQYQFLWDPAALSALHEKIWQSPQQDLHPAWKNYLNQLLLSGQKS